MTSMEYRLQAVEPGDGLRLAGWASRYSVDSHPLYVQGVQVVEQIDPGAFTRSLAEDSQSLYWQHDSRMPLASTASGTLVLTDTPEGLRYEATLADTQLARDAVALVRAGVVAQMSFGMWVERDTLDRAQHTRRVHEARIAEVSLVERGAYPQTSATARSHTPLTPSGLRLALRLGSIHRRLA